MEAEKAAEGQGAEVTASQGAETRRFLLGPGGSCRDQEVLAVTRKFLQNVCVCVCLSQSGSVKATPALTQQRQPCLAGGSSTPVTQRPHPTPPGPPLKDSAPWDHPYTTLLLTPEQVHQPSYPQVRPGEELTAAGYLTRLGHPRGDDLPSWCRRTCLPAALSTPAPLNTRTRMQRCKWIHSLGRKLLQIATFDKIAGLTGVVLFY